ncbi:MAG: hypothetical protein MJ170_00605 [Alphaproteobacteria bacterium]|nr:hypothetical protein [Alphaproteobacteria bacterium]
MPSRARRLFANIICGIIPSKTTRDKVRAKICYFEKILKYKEFVKQYAKENNIPYKSKLCFGYGCYNAIIILNQQWVFKFPLWAYRMSENKKLATKEKRIVDAFKNISPIKIPNVELIEWNGVVVRKYEYIPGKVLTDFTEEQIVKHISYFAKELANFLYIIAKHDPKEIQDLKPSKKLKPGFLYGWCQCDIWANFMIDPKTMKILGFIDWELAEFGDFKGTIHLALLRWRKHGKGTSRLVIEIMEQYAKLYYSNNHTKHVSQNV